jgi:hypothetical protein
MAVHDVARTGEDDSPDAGVPGCLEERDDRIDVGSLELIPRRTRRRVGSEVHYGVHTIDDILREAAVTEVAGHRFSVDPILGRLDVGHSQ